MRERTCVIALMVLLCLLTGCSALMPPYLQGNHLMKKDRYDEAIEKFELALQNKPDHVGAQCELGVAYYKKGEYDRAISALNKAREVEPRYGKTYLYLGLTYEAMQDPEKALDEYSNYRKLGPTSLVARKIKVRMKYIAKKQYEFKAEKMAKEVEESLAGLIASIPDNTIAVTYFQIESDPEELTPFQKGLADLMIFDLSKVKALRVLERINLHAILQEIGLGMTGIVDKLTAPKAGVFLGAYRIVTGGFQTFGEDDITIHSFIVKTQEAQREAEEEVSGVLQRFFELEKRLIFEIIADMGIELSPEEREAIGEVPTKSLAAFLAYCRGLDYEDRGEYEKALEQFREAVRTDKNFSNARVKMQEMEQELRDPVAGEFVSVEDLEISYWEEEKLSAIERTADPVPKVSQTSRLSQISEGTGAELSEVDEGKRIPPRITSTVNILAEWE